MTEPLYLQISGRLRQSIIRGDYKPDDMLPSENELAARHTTSRVTVRKSLNVLESEGLIKAWHGKGYFVQPPNYTTYTMHFGDSMTEGRFRFQEVSIVQPTPEISELLQLEKRQMAIVARRLLERDGKHLAFDEKFIPYERGKPSIELEIHFSEFPDMFEKRFAPMSIHTEMHIGLETAPDHVCAALRLGMSTPLMVVTRLTHAVDDQPIGYGKQYITSDFGKLTATSGYYMQGKL